MKNENFKKIILSKYPSAVISIDEQDNAMAFLKKDQSIQILGCVLCFNNADIRHMEDKVLIQNIEAVPMSAIVEDDSINLATKQLFLCPICSRVIIHPNSTPPINIGRVIEDWKD